MIRCPSCGIIMSAMFPLAVHKADCKLEDGPLPIVRAKPSPEYDDDHVKAFHHEDEEWHCAGEGGCRNPIAWYIVRTYAWCEKHKAAGELAVKRSFPGARLRSYPAQYPGPILEAADEGMGAAPALQTPEES